MADRLSDGLDVVVSSESTVFSQDSFLRSRVSSPLLLLEENSYTSLINNNNGTIVNLRAHFDVINVSGGTTTHNNTAKCHTLATNTTATSSTIFQSRRYLRYQSGRGQLYYNSFNFKNQQTNVVKEIGMFGDMDGVFIRLTSADIFVVVRSSVSGSTVERTWGRLTNGTEGKWNGDLLDGGNSSAGVLNFAASQILTIDYQWLGAGSIRYYLNVNGQQALIHTIHNANSTTSLYSRSGTLPVRTIVRNTGSGTAGTMEFYCCAVISDGGQDLYYQQGELFSASTGRTFIPVTSTLTDLIAVRPKLTFNGENNRTSVIISGINLYSTTNGTELQIILNPTITGGAWVTPTGSASEYNSTIASFSGGTILHQEYVSDSSGSATTAVPLRNILNGNVVLTTGAAALESDIILVAARTFSGSTNMAATINWKELYR